jgi:hypothetical protein
VAATELQKPFAPWLGRWEGEGRGLWTAEPAFRFHETVTIEAVADLPLLRFSQRATDALSGDLTHSEVGFFRLLAAQGVELILAIPGGYVEIHTGRLHNGVMALQPHLLGSSPTALPLRQVQRRLDLRGDQLRNETGIAVGPERVTGHVESLLQRVKRETI